jgi:hypothetical protein
MQWEAPVAWSEEMMRNQTYRANTTICHAVLFVLRNVDLLIINFYNVAGTSVPQHCNAGKTPLSHLVLYLPRILLFYPLNFNDISK